MISSIAISWVLRVGTMAVDNSPEASNGFIDDKDIPSSVRIDKEKSVRVVVLSTPCENNFTQKDLREWSLNFSRPTVVRNAFTPPDLSKESYFLPESTKLHANVGQVGHFQDGNGSYTWQELWKLMKEGRNVYGSYGSGTSNGGVDLGCDCMNNSIFSKSILALKDKYIPEGMFKKNEYPGTLKSFETHLRESLIWYREHNCKSRLLTNLYYHQPLLMLT